MDAAAAAVAGCDDAKEEDGDDVAPKLPLAETVEFVVEVSALVVVEDAVASDPVTERNMCDPEEPPVGCETYRWKHLPAQGAPLR